MQVGMVVLTMYIIKKINIRHSMQVGMVILTMNITKKNAFSRILYTLMHFSQAKYNAQCCRS